MKLTIYKYTKKTYDFQYRSNKYFTAIRIVDNRESLKEVTLWIIIIQKKLL